MTHLDILLPFGLPPATLARDLLKELALPALSTLSSRTVSDRSQAPQERLDEFQRALPHESWLAQQFGFSQATESSPSIAVALMRELGLTVDTGLWFIVQPVHIHIARDHLVLTDPRQLMLAEAEARILFDIAKPLFDETGMDLIYGNPDLWFLRADDWAALHTATPDAASGHNIDIWMPKGPTARQWRKIQNEVQMHWHGHALNDDREMRGLKPVNSLWLWGASHADATSPTASYSAAFNLSGWTQAFQQFAPRHAQASTAADALGIKPDRGLILLDALLEPALSEDWARWLDQMRELEANWFAPMLAALKQGSIDQLSLVVTHDSRLSRFTASRSSLRKFWVKPSLSTLIS